MRIVIDIDGIAASTEGATASQLRAEAESQLPVGGAQGAPPEALAAAAAFGAINAGPANIPQAASGAPSLAPASAEHETPHGAVPTTAAGAAPGYAGEAEAVTVEQPQEA